MKVTCVALEPGGGMRPESEAAAVAGWRAGSGTYWVDVSGGRPEEVKAWLAGLGLDPGLLDLLRIGENETKILPLDASVFVAYPIVSRGEAGVPAYFGCLCLERLVITLDATPDEPSMPVESSVASLKLPEGTTAGVVCALALLHSARLRGRVVTLRGKEDVLDERMDSDPGAVSLAEILSLKRPVLGLGGVLDEELAVFEVLKAINKPALALTRLAERFQIVIETTRATDRDLDRLDRRLSALQRRYESAQQDKMNRRLGLLTVLSAIFMPLTLITGIYGMNFDRMPELHYRYGYPAALGAMALIAGGLYWYFRSRWWQK